MSAADVVCVASWNVDLVARVPRPIARGETIHATAFETSPGGKGSNAAVAAARQGARVALVARVGADDFGRMGLDLWRAEGIDTAHVVEAPDARSGVAQILVYDDGDNSIAVYAGANAGLTALHVAHACETLASCRVVMASCEVPLAATAEAFRIARAHGALTLLNPAPAQPLPDDLLQRVDVLTPNENELRALADSDPHAPLDEAAQRLMARGTGALIVTLGGAGCALYRSGVAPERVPGHRMEVVDTIGAGDAFTGALAAALARGEAIADAMRWANAAAALAVTGRGAIGGMRSRDEVAQFLGPQPP